MKPTWTPPPADADMGPTSFELLGQMRVSLFVIGLLIALAEKMGAWK